MQRPSTRRWPDGVRAGKVDEAAVKAKMGKLEQKASSRRADAAKALGRLHATPINAPGGP
jgi:hypothetical protein